jgi:putative peptidoglycan lipid II flippase
LLALLSILVIANSLISFLNALSHSYHQFLRPAIAGVVGTGATVLYLILLYQLQGIFAVAWGVVAGAGLTSLLLLPLLLQQLSLSSGWQGTTSPATRRCIVALAPLVLGALYWRLDPLLDRWLASHLPAGSIAHLGYAWRLTCALSLVGTSGLGIVAFPAIAAHAAGDQRHELNAELAHALRLFVFLTVPVCVGIGFFATPVVRFLFEHGRFAPLDTASVALLVICYIGVVFGAGAGDLLSRTFYALNDTRLPVIVGSLVFTLLVAAKIALIRPLGVTGLAAATSLFYLLNAGLLAVFLTRRLSAAFLAGVCGELLRSLGSSLIASIVAAAILVTNPPLAVMLAAAFGAAAYLTCMRLLGDEFAIRIISRTSPSHLG